MTKKILIILFVISIWMFISSSFSADVSSLLEKGIYAEETKGDLDEAISIYKKIIDENTDNSANLAEAYYRLGICYLKTGDEIKAIEMFNGLLSGFLKHEEFAADARDQLVKLNVLEEEGEQTNSPIELGPVPWESGETCWYRIVIPVAMNTEVGKLFQSVKEINKDGNGLWRLEGYLHSIAGDYSAQKGGYTDVLKGNFRPVSGIQQGRLDTKDLDNKAIYEKDHQAEHYLDPESLAMTSAYLAKTLKNLATPS